MSSDLKDNGVEKGDQLVVTVSWTAFWNSMRYQYNEAARYNQWNFFPEYSWLDSYAGITTITCTVKDMVKKTYGKMPDKDANKQIILEYQYFTDTLANTTAFNSTHIDEETAN